MFQTRLLLAIVVITSPFAVKVHGGPDDGDGDRRNFHMQPMVRERHIVVPSKSGCYCVDAIWKMHTEKASEDEQLFAKCAESANIPLNRRNATQLEERAESHGKRMMMEIQKCGKITLAWSPDNVTQECFEHANIVTKINEWFKDFISSLGNSKTEFVRCLTKSSGLLNDAETGIRADKIKEDVRKYFAPEAQQAALEHVDKCNSQFGTFQTDESIDVSVDKFFDCLYEGCL
ncbi:unnamed protein product [Notodromas monacha]|uniref:Uncharacterized protein n=1 Tax=Notodromas monacha TaxID=399045 RepID=A0A7R9BU36_9CRUS|nr:unnamed protein product [Notodromas monacha]CAG0920760.1 unnamed protein product [Notodromas monacha]